MRSSVTVMFSNSPPETTMSYPDYKQRARDHSSMLVLVKQIGHNITSKSFNATFERIRRMQHIRVPESQTGGERSVWVRYKKNYAIENNEWGDFQAHRKVIGLICIGRCGSQDELDSLCEEHEKIRERYLSTLYDSRCIVFGSSSSSKSDSKSKPESIHDDDDDDDDDDVESKNKDKLLIDDPVLTLNTQHINCEIIDDEDDRLGPISFDLNNSRINGDRDYDDEVTPFTSGSQCSPNGIDEQEPDLTSSECTNSNGGNTSSSSSSTPSSHCPKPFMPPHNLKTTVLYYNGDYLVKNCGSTSGSNSGSTSGFSDVDSQLERDLYDFVCSLFWVLESKRLDRSHEKVDRLPLLYAPFERKDFVGLDMDSRTNKKRCAGRMKKHIGDLCLLSGLPVESIGYYNAACDQLKSANDWLWLAGCFEGLCASSVVLLYPENRWPTSLQRNSSFTAGAIPTFTVRQKPSGFSSLPNGLDPVECKAKVKAYLSPSELIEKYREAIGHYRKYHSAAIIETEASVKACQVLIYQEKYLLASEFLQNVVSINLQLSEEEKIRRFSELSRLYKMIGFNRKAAFFKRVAAMRCVTPKLPDPNWSECYHLLLQTLDGYKLSLDPKTVPKGRMCGWPALQIQILQELVATSRRMGNTAFSVRHMTYLIHVMFDYLSPDERREFAAQLESLTARCEGGPVPLALDNGIIIPPVNLINLPKVMSFRLQNLAPHLQPILIVTRSVDSVNCSPFIFSPLQLNVKDKNKNCTKINFKWVEGDVCEVALQVSNPLPFELKVTNMGLLPDGIAFETFPTCLSLPPDSGPHPVNLLGTPRSTGELFILGYTTHVLGVKSDCRLKDVQSVRKPRFTIDVVPALPNIQVLTSLPKSPVFPSGLSDSGSVINGAHLTLFAGQSYDCLMTVMNIGKENIDTIDVLLDTKLDKEFQNDFCVWNLDEIKSHFPIRPDESAGFTVVIKAVGDFLPPNKVADEGSDTSSLMSSASQMAVASKTRSSSVSGAGFGSSRSSFTYSSFRGRLPDFFTTSTSASTPRRLPASQSPIHHQLPKSQVVEAVIKVRYSGGPGLKAGYCRQCLVGFSLEIVPSIVIVKWDVLPAESASQCYLVLDILNATDNEMEMQYAPQKQILIEAHNTCRIPVPVLRCPLSKLSGIVSDEVTEKICRQHVASLVELRWSISGTETCGQASVSSIAWSPTMLDVLKMCPLQWEVSLNGRPYSPENEFCFISGQVIDVNISIANYSEHRMNDLSLSVQCYQDYQNVQVNCRIDGKLLIIGSDKVKINQLLEGGSYSHHCCLMFFYPGVYKLDVQCRTDGLVRTSSAQQRHNWRCTPPIEITIVDASISS